jgi:uncharacterized protein (TIGR03437 family)
LARTTVRYFLAPVLFAGALFAQPADPLQLLPTGASAADIVSDSAGNLYVGGSLNTRLFVAKLPAGGGAPVFLYTLTGVGNERVQSLALGPDGAIFAAGSTSSLDFPATTPAGPKLTPDDQRAFVLKLDRTGKLQYARLIEAYTSSFGLAVAVNAKGEALLGGQLIEIDGHTFQTTPGATAANADANTGFIVKLDASGKNILVAVRGLGLGPVAYDTNGNIYVTGAAYGSSDIGVTPGAFQSSHGQRACAGTAFFGLGCSYQYVAKISPDGTKLLYSTFVTGTWGAYPAALSIDSAGNAIVAGLTFSDDYPVTQGAFQRAFRVTNYPPSSFPSPKPSVLHPPATGYITKLNANGTGLVWSTFFSGTGSETITDLRLDAQNRITIAGVSGSRDLPGGQAMQAGCNPGYAREVTYVAQLNADASSLIASRYVFGVDATVAARVAVRPDGAPLLTAADAIKPIDLAAGTPLQCTTDPADNARVNRAAPGQLVSLFGEDFLTEGDSVWIDGLVAPRLYASSNQINAQVPPELAGRDAVTVAVMTNSGTLLSRRLRLVARAPSAFLIIQDVDPRNPVVSCNGTFFTGFLPVARNEDGSLNSCEQPAAPGSVVTFYLNGIGVTAPEITMKFSEATVLGLDQDPDSPPGVSRLRVRLLPNGGSGSLTPLFDGIPLRESFLAVWIHR